MDENQLIQTPWGAMTLGQLRQMIAGRSEATAQYDQIRFDEGVRQYDNSLEEQQRQFDARLKESREERKQRLMLEQEGLAIRREELAVTQGRAAADKWFQEQQIDLRNRELGFSILKTAVDARKTPRSWVDVVNLGAGVSANAGLIAPLRGLVNGATQPSFAAPAGIPDATTVQNLTDDLVSGSSPDARALRGSQGDLSWLAMNPHKIAPGSLEALGQTGQEALFGALEGGITQNGVAKTVDIPTWLRGYMFGKPGQSFSDAGYV